MRRRDRRRLRHDERARQVNAGANGAKVIGKAGRVLVMRGSRKAGRVIAVNRPSPRIAASLAGMNMTKGKNKLACQRKKRQPRHSAPARSEPTHELRPRSLRSILSLANP